jgi:ketosteroid isomerase-like protein
MKQRQKSFDTFLKGERSAAANAYASGNATLVSELSATRDPATFFGPRGGMVAGAKRVIATNERAAKTFALGGRSTFKILQAAAADKLAFWTGIQLAKVRLPGQRGLVPMKLRVTEVFRKEKRGWRLIHRHADTLAKPAKR